MQEVRAGMAAFWGSFTGPDGTPVPAYPDGYAYRPDERGRPVPAPFPCITYAPVAQQPGAQTVVAASVWSRGHTVGDFALVDAVLGQFRQRLVSGRAVLDTPGGGMVLQFDRTACMTDPDDPYVTRGVMQMVVKDFVM